jgi:hypothetical protein
MRLMPCSACVVRADGVRQLRHLRRAGRGVRLRRRRTQQRLHLRGAVWLPRHRDVQLQLDGPWVLRRHLRALHPLHRRGQ